MKNINKTLGVISIIVLFIGIIFKTFHWPGTGILIIIALLGLLVTGILLIIDAIKETDQTKQSIKTLFAFSLTVIVVMLIMITRIFTEIL
jgi:UDP-N-acetylmuramyl pentapeptide phosphotransferase/UDP-N-acetylglucosamine-1-phosphate transferase